MSERDSLSLVPVLRKAAGLETVRDTTSHAFVARSAEGEISTGRYIYLREARNANEDLIGYALEFCMVDNTLPEQLSVSSKQRIEEYFRQVAGSGPYVWAEIAAPYVRDSNPKFDEVQDWSLRALWVDIKFLGFEKRSLGGVTSYLPKFREVSEQFSF